MGFGVPCGVPVGVESGVEAAEVAGVEATEDAGVGRCFVAARSPAAAVRTRELVIGAACRLLGGLRGPRPVVWGCVAA